MRRVRHLKRAVLSLLADGRPRWTFQVSEGVRYREVRSMSTYLRRLERQGLVRGFTDADSFALRFQITPKGRARLRFFERNSGYDFLRRRAR